MRCTRRIGFNEEPSLTRRLLASPGEHIADIQIYATTRLQSALANVYPGRQKTGLRPVGEERADERIHALQQAGGTPCDCERADSYGFGRPRPVWCSNLPLN
jgi:hypothetical protein